MDAQLQELIDKIKAEGVKEAEAEAQAIRSNAEKRADEIIAQAHKASSDVVASAKAEAERFQHTAQEALRQAARNTILSLRAKITAMLRAVTERETQPVLSGKVLQESIVSLIKGWSKQQVPDLQVLLPPKELDKIEGALLSSLAEEIKKGAEIKPFPGLSAGFRVGTKDGSAYYNFTSEGIAEILAEYVNPKLAEIIQEAVDRES
ncbi:MAG: V-type ATP synthase subunit E [Spirochaetales bacterium]|nr:V-type ATP synthase subunit E [Spirochaetales bacterium]